MGPTFWLLFLDEEMQVSKELLQTELRLLMNAPFLLKWPPPQTHGGVFTG